MSYPLIASPLIVDFDPEVAGSVYKHGVPVSSFHSSNSNLKAVQVNPGLRPKLNIKSRTKPLVDYDGHQYLGCNGIATSLTNVKSFGICCVAKCSELHSEVGLPMFGFYNSNTDTKTYLSFQSADISITSIGDNNCGITQNAGIVITNALAVYTLIKEDNTLQVRYNGELIITMSMIGGTYTYNNFMIGGIMSLNVAKYFKGSIGPMVVYRGSKGIETIEKILLKQYVI